MTLVPVPECWTADEAIAVTELLEELLAGVWQVHGDAIRSRYTEMMESEPPPRPEPPPIDYPEPQPDDIPF
jgi:hypothetical protein